ncbi:MAG TPA: AcrB/AcrD/AcrF family protein [Gemmatimonas aurantiaca]|uniref:Multidrug resistance protein n=2 Tax=Gemmatimonas aurantiaca TaxID=173480 RepID=C1AAA3_GEMAT|nr:efflux RND transporter permease subunit [Gemmatimonas aurantiaca]BAH39701.1 multidrug resistance protein [Gemmatimonas aurantiaca T-27]HCT58289.1 AcrB/AcrD/AcrF family protein [Gemmatimonas aurantiaca]
MKRSWGISGRVAKVFLHSKLTPLLAMASLAMGVLGILATPREEEPQISVPMIDVIVAMPGATPIEAENLLGRPVEQRMLEISGVDHVYTVSGDGYAMITVRFKVGEDQERSVTKVQAKLASALDRAPLGALAPIVKSHSIDDVPVLALTLHGQGMDANTLRQIGVHLEDEIRTVREVAATFVTGGAPRQISVMLDAARLAATGVSPGEVAMTLHNANARLLAGAFTTADSVVQIAVGAPLTDAQDVGSVVVATRAGRPVYLRSVAEVRDNFGDVTSYVSHRADGAPAEAAVTVAVSKRQGANATEVTRAVLARVEQAKGRLLPENVQIEVTRDYGETAGEKAQELIFHLLIATLSVTTLIGVFLGWREALVVLVAVPVTLALTLFVYYALGYTLNRITLFALIFSIGILVDDAIVVVENIYRHLAMGDRPADVAAIDAVDEVGNPTILATFTVIAAILPMAFVSGMMGPYMLPIPVGASVAMLASLAVAFVITPYLAYRLLRGHVRARGTVHDADPATVADTSHGTGGFYQRIMSSLIAHRGTRLAFYGTVGLLLLGSVGLVGLRVVQVKMLPFDNKSEFQVILDLPEGTSLETTDRVASDIAAYLGKVDEVTSTQVYAGTSAPFTFNGLVRHYFMRRGANVADVQVNLTPKHARDRQSHDIAAAVRPAVDSIATRYGASAKVAEIPPGPPVLSTLVAEVYAADDATRLKAATAVKAIFERTSGVVDVDWTVEAPQHRKSFRVDRARAAESGASVEQLTQTVYLALSGRTSSLVALPTARDAVPIVPQLPEAQRTSVEALLALPVATLTGPQPLGRFVTVVDGIRESARIRKDLRPAIYVTGDVAGEIEAPIYAILDMNRQIDALKIVGASVGIYNAVAPASLSETAIKWDGEWQVTIEVFRDLGLAFTIVLLLIYVLVVGWFQSFTIPLVIMAPIPLTLIGILPGHALSGAFFTATSMIGMIALAGIIVRNSILLVDFIQLEEARGRHLVDAVLEAGAVRFRPIALTAAAVVIGGAVMVLDPIFQGLAVALISGAVVATLLTMVVVPLLYWELRKSAPPTVGSPQHMEHNH